ACLLPLGLGLGACAREAPPPPAPTAATAAPSATAAASTPAPAAAPARTATLLVTAGRRGQLEESGCRREPLGGLAAEATWFGSDPLAGPPGARLLLDAGDAFLPSPREAPTARQRVLADTIARVYDDLGYDVVALAPRDLDLG